MSGTTRALSMKFDTQSGKARNVSVQPCKAGITAQDARDLMDAMIASGAFVYEPTAKLGASVIERAVTELF